jgi:hypothetical protein
LPSLSLGWGRRAGPRPPSISSADPRMPTTGLVSGDA